MITIPVGELTGLIGDVVGLAHPDPEATTEHVVQISWDGQMIHAAAHDTIRTGVSSWHPDDAPSDGDRADDMFTRLGGRDDPWTIVLSVPDAADLLKTFKSTPKTGWVPVEVGREGDRLRVTRTRETGFPEKSAAWEHRPVSFPDIGGRIVDLGPVEAVRALTFNPQLLAAFCAVRPRGGELEILPTGPDGDGVCLVHVGPRFAGTIRPVRRSGKLRSVA